jgi:hypothetical protein
LESKNSWLAYIVILLVAVIVSLVIHSNLVVLTGTNEFEFFAFAAATFPIIIFYLKQIAPLHFEELQMAKIRFSDIINGDSTEFVKQRGIEYAEIKEYKDRLAYIKKKIAELDIEGKLGKEEIQHPSEEDYVQCTFALATNENRMNWFRRTANVLLGCWAFTLLIFIALIILKQNSCGLPEKFQNFLGANILNRFLVSAGYTQLIFSVLAVFVQLLNIFPRNTSFLDKQILAREQFDTKAQRIGILYVVMLSAIFLNNPIYALLAAAVLLLIMRFVDYKVQV